MVERGEQVIVIQYPKTYREVLYIAVLDHSRTPLLYNGGFCNQTLKDGQEFSRQ